MRSILLAAAALLAGCASGPFASYDVAPGTAREAVVARLGTPSRVDRTATGERLQYSLQPFGRQVWMVDLDASGHVLRTTQALTDLNFQRIQAGWTRADVEREFGPPWRFERVAMWNGPVMSYRWRDVANTDMYYWVFLDPSGRVDHAHPGIEFINGPNDRS
jgi:hypothetical protein